MLRIYIGFGLGDQRDLKERVVYRFAPRNGNLDYQWNHPELLIERTSKKVDSFKISKP